MEQLGTGRFYGITDNKWDMNGLVLTQTAYTQDFVDWHHHENAYFTFILSGNLLEGDKKGKKLLRPGSLLFHNAQEAHYNIKPPGQTRGMQLEVQPNLLSEITFNNELKEGSFEVSAPKNRILFYKIFKELRAADPLSDIGIQQLAIEAIDSLSTKQSTSRFQPTWVKAVALFLNDNYMHCPDIKSIAQEIGIHPVHLSRSFSKYFGCTMAEYLRHLRVERALSQIVASKIPLSTIAYQCGFADQSHMIRCIKELAGHTPLRFRKMTAC